MSIEALNEEVESLLGQPPDLTGSETALQRQNWMLTKYGESVNRSSKGRTAFVPVERPGKDRVLYFLIYLTRNPVGINVFKEAAESMNMVQRITQAETRLRNQVDKSPTADLFAEDTDSVMLAHVKDNRLTAKSYLIEKLSGQPLLIDHERWAHFLEETDLYPSDLQMAMKELINEGAAENLDCDMKSVRRRTKKPIRPAWPNKSERWILVKPST